MATKATANKSRKARLMPCVRCTKKFEKTQMVKRILSGKWCCKKCASKFPETGCCAVCNKVFPAADLERDADRMLYCSEHLPVVVRKKKEVSDTFGWYVLQVEPGQEGKIKKAILKKLKVENKKNLCKRIIIPKKFEEMVVNQKGIQVATGFAPTQQAAAHDAQMRMPDCEAEHGECRYSIFRSRSDEPDKEGNDFTWVIKTVNPNKEKKTLQVKKFPGYMICQLDYGADMKVIIERTRGAWGLLLKPVVVGHRIETAFSKRKGGWVYKVRTPDAKDTVARGGPYAEKAQARTAGEAAKAKAEEFKPTPMKTREAAELILAQKTLNAIAKNPEERDKAIYSYRVGSTVKVIAGAFEGTITKVTKIDREDKVNVKAWVNIDILGHPVEQELEYWQLELVSY